jgi:hypothetical protein
LQNWIILFGLCMHLYYVSFLSFLLRVSSLSISCISCMLCHLTFSSKAKVLFMYKKLLGLVITLQEEKMTYKYFLRIEENFQTHDF